MEACYSELVLHMPTSLHTLFLNNSIPLFITLEKGEFKAAERLLSVWQASSTKLSTEMRVRVAQAS